MSFDQKEFENYAMRAKGMDQSIPFDAKDFENYAVLAKRMEEQTFLPDTGVDIDAVSEALSLSREAGRELARQMAAEGWVSNAFGLPPRLRLTVQGHRAIVKLRRPRWRRWLDRNLALTAFLIACAALALSVFQWFSRP